MTRRAVLLRVGAAVAAAVAVNVALVAVSRRYDVVVVTLVVFCLFAVVTALGDGLEAFVPVRWRTPAAVRVKEPPTEPTLARYERLLERHRVSRQVDDELQRRLLGLAERRLALVDGMVHELRTPEEVRRRLGPELAALMDHPPRRLTPAQITRIIDRIEEL